MEPGWRVEATVAGVAEPLVAAVPHAAVADRGPGAFVVPGPPRRGILDLQSLNASGTLTDAEDRASWRQAEAVVRPPRVGRVRLAARIPGVTPWSAEVPSLRTLNVVLRAPDGTVVERVERRIGFRRVEVRGVELLVNGRAVLIRGVNRHDFDRRTGRVISAEDILADVTAMKRWGFNALRTSHYPNDPYLLDVCDELGLYVVDEADIESHGWYDDVCHDPRYRSAFVDRVARVINATGTTRRSLPGRWATSQATGPTTTRPPAGRRRATRRARSTTRARSGSTGPAPRRPATSPARCTRRSRRSSRTPVRASSDTR